MRVRLLSQAETAGRLDDVNHQASLDTAAAAGSGGGPKHAPKAMLGFWLPGGPGKHNKLVKAATEVRGGV